MLLYGAKIYTMDEKGIIENGWIQIENGKIVAVGGPDCQIEDNGEKIDLSGMSVYPGFIDAHSHIGMWEDSLSFEGDDGNEETSPCTPHLRAIDAINPEDKCFSEALAAGITTVVTGPGSANPVGGQMVALKTFGRRVDDMIVKFPLGVKFALGENPKSVYNEKNQTPMTRMGTAAVIREQLLRAKEYLSLLEKSKNDSDTDAPEFDIKCHALIPLLKREIKAHFHAHRADDIFTSIRIAKEFELDYCIVHCTDGSRISDILAQENAEVLCGPILCDRSKPEMSALTPKTAADLVEEGVKTAIITDHPVIPAQYLVLCAALAVKAGLAEEDALRAITTVPAKICGIDNRVGSIKPGMDADLVVFEKNPLSCYADPCAVVCEGKFIYGGKQND